MSRTVLKGFTLIELLVVIAVMAVVSIVIIANFGSFGQDKALESATLDIQSMLRSAQTNATTNLKCNSQSSLSWMVEVSNKLTINLKCQNSSGTTTIKTMALTNNIEISSIGTCISPVSFNFAPLSGAFSSSCDPNSNQIVVKNTKTGGIKTLIVEKGGRIYVP